MFVSVKKKAAIIILFVAFVACYSAFCGTLPSAIGNYIPNSSSVTTASAAHGAFILPRQSFSDGELNADGNSHLHYVRTYVGDRSLRYDAGSGPSDIKTYNEYMLSAIITCFNSISLTMDYGIIEKNGGFGYSYNNYDIPCLCIIIKVSGFSSNHDATVSTIENWLGDSNCTYEVVSILDSRDPSTRVASGLTIDNGECFHILTIPFAHSNETYFEGANPYSGTATYTIRYEPVNFSYKYLDSSQNTVTGQGTDQFNVVAQITTAIVSYSTLSLGSSPSIVTFSMSEMLENANTNTTVAATMSMAYEELTTSTASNYLKTKTLHVDLHPYNNMEEYYFLRSGTSSITANRYFAGNIKLANVTIAEGTNAKFVYGNTTIDHVNGASYDTKKYGTHIGFRITTTTPTSISGTFKQRTSADFSFEVFPYIESVPQVVGGDYSLIVVAEFSIDD